MSTTTKIEWCDHTWSPWRGCTKGKPRVLAKDWEKPVRWNRDFAEAIQLADRCFPSRDRSQDAAHRPRVFPSMCDWLDPEVDPQWLFDFLSLVLRRTPEVRWLLLTKWPELFRERLKAARDRCTVDPIDVTDLIDAWLAGDRIPFNVGIGTSVEYQPLGDERIPELLKIPARFRFLSVEPMLGPVQMTFRCHLDHNGDGDCHNHPNGCPRIDWVIVGGESGPGARPCNVKWIRDVVKQCAASKVPCFVKQLGSNAVSSWPMAGEDGASGLVSCRRFGIYSREVGKPDRVSGRITHPKGGDPDEWPADLRVRQFPEVKP